MENTDNFRPTHILHITPPPMLPSLKSCAAYDLTPHITAPLTDTKNFKREVDASRKTVLATSPPFLACTKPTRFSSTSLVSTPAGANILEIYASIWETHRATVKWVDGITHPEVAVKQEAILSRTMSFVYNSRMYKWKWDLLAPTKLVIEDAEGNEVLTVARYVLRGTWLMGGVLAVDGGAGVDIALVFATLVICLKKERDRRARRGGR
ncbi:hypothetical protein P167DRAFT_533306 [Morchella conica CCBAS932]|uniref:Uncharacterized protein n=1 Tax=Morchella conica CCBAS932 TaxID=1392247 RepID=A0A3N4L4G1_9PEZI|nr:hypothetical protein P167DRAFT_533306 [Morchella conica CCBAS932]